MKHDIKRLTPEARAVVRELDGLAHALAMYCSERPAGASDGVRGTISAIGARILAIVQSGKLDGSLADAIDDAMLQLHVDQLFAASQPAYGHGRRVPKRKRI